MAEITIRPIDRAHAGDLNLKNQPFPLFGRMVPSYQGGAWSYSTVETPEAGWDLFPDEPYDLAQMEADFICLGAYDGAACVGLAILKRQWHRYLYLHDLKVDRSYRGQHIGTWLIEAAYACAKDQSYRGLWTIAQDNNLAACLFYLSCGFRIGGLDTEVYNGTRQERKADIFFYKDI